MPMKRNGSEINSDPCSDDEIESGMANNVTHIGTTQAVVRLFTYVLRGVLRSALALKIGWILGVFYQNFE